ncbi:MAG: sensor signal transduction histidine kinase [Bacteroidetes bacterium]|nr:sensor signal transduction histidine kinase [Bacteroidota bacterium]
MKKLNTCIAKLEREEALYSDLANALPAGIYRLRVFQESSTLDEKWASSTDSASKIEFANDRFYEILHLKRSDFEQIPGIIIDLIFEEDKASFIKKNVEANRDITPFSWEGRVVIDGKLMWIHFHSIPRPMDNGDIIWTGTLQDITKRKDEELEIKLKNEELLKLNNERAKFLSIIAHDLKTPFNSIINFSEFLLTEIENQDMEKIGYYGNIILESSNRAMDLLQNLMEWAQLHTGRLLYNPEYIEIDSALEETLLLYENVAKEKSIVIKNHLLSDLKVFADKSMTITVFRNLISNAIKFTKSVGEITVSAYDQDKFFLFCVQDNGVGISKKRLNEIFQLDYGCSTNGTNNEKGTGMGLILCKDFIETNKGKIWVESTLDEGSSFYFTLPKSPIC